MGDEVSTSSVHTFSFHVDVVFPLSSPPSRFVFLQRIETNVEEASTQFIHLAPPLFLYRASVCHGHPEGSVDEVQARHSL